MRVYVINGFHGSGKTTFMKTCVRRLGPYGRYVSSIDAVKKISELFGWKGEKTAASRKLLSEIKRITTEYNDYSFTAVRGELKRYKSFFDRYDVPDDRGCFFIDCREPSEILKYKERLGAKTILISRPDTSTSKIEESELSDPDKLSTILDFDYDLYLINNGSIDELVSYFFEKESIAEGGYYSNGQ